MQVIEGVASWHSGWYNFATHSSKHERGHAESAAWCCSIWTAEAASCWVCAAYQLPTSNHCGISTFVIPSPPICSQSWPRNILRWPKEEQNRYCCNSYVQYMVKKRKLFKPQVMGKPPHDSECSRPQARTIPPVGCNFIILYIPTIIQLLLLSKIWYSLLATNYLSLSFSYPRHQQASY